MLSKVIAIEKALLVRRWQSMQWRFTGSALRSRHPPLAGGRLAPVHGVVALPSDQADAGGTWHYTAPWPRRC
jgi:hypothetical protein